MNANEEYHISYTLWKVLKHRLIKFKLYKNITNNINLANLPIITPNDLKYYMCSIHIAFIMKFSFCYLIDISIWKTSIEYFYMFHNFLPFWNQKLKPCSIQQHNKCKHNCGVPWSIVILVLVIWLFENCQTCNNLARNVINMHLREYVTQGNKAFYFWYSFFINYGSSKHSNLMREAMFTRLLRAFISVCGLDLRKAKLLPQSSAIIHNLHN